MYGFNNMEHVMKKFAVIAMLLLFISGCNDMNNVVSGDFDKVKVEVTGGGDLPDSIKGTWGNEQLGWYFHIDNKGYMDKFIVNMGRTELVPGVKKITKLINDGKGVFVPGDCDVVYNPNDSWLMIVIKVDNFSLKQSGQEISGTIHHTFVGKVQNDGLTWIADEVNDSKYYVTAKGINNKLLESNDELGYREGIEFKKVIKSDRPLWESDYK